MPTLLTDAQIADVRQRIVAVAGRQAIERGLERLSMHSIARELGWSATALYRYFENKDAILAAARIAALDALSDRLEAAMDGPGDIWDRSREVGHAYIDFAFANPDAYKLIFAMSQPEQDLYPELRAAQMRSRGHMTRYVEHMVEQGEIEGDPELLGHVIWAGLHGLVTLKLSGHFGEGSPSFETVRRDMMRRIIKSVAKPRRRGRAEGGAGQRP